jgi:hypothetical protein
MGILINRSKNDSGFVYLGSLRVCALRACDHYGAGSPEGSRGRKHEHTEKSALQRHILNLAKSGAMLTPARAPKPQITDGPDRARRSDPKSVGFVVLLGQALEFWRIDSGDEPQSYTLNAGSLLRYATPG